MGFSNKIYYLRNKNHITQDELADKLNVSRQSVQKWENGSAKPSIDKLLVLSKLFNVSLDILLDDEKDLDNTNKEEVNLDSNTTNIKITNKGDAAKEDLNTASRENPSNYRIISIVLFICQFTFLFVFGSIFIGVFNALTSLVGRVIFCAIPIYLLVKRKIGKVGTIVSVCLIFASSIGEFMEASLKTGYDYDSAMMGAIINTVCMFVFIPFAFYFLYKHVYSDTSNSNLLSNIKLFKLEGSYQKATTYKAQHQYYDAMLLFKEIGDYKDCLKQYDECRNKYYEQIYNIAIRDIEESNYSKAIGILAKIRGYKDANALIQKCNQLLKEQEYQKAVKCSKSNNYTTAITLLRQLGDYKDSKDLIQKYVEIQKNIEIEKKYDRCLNQLNSQYLTINEANNVIHTLETIINYKDSKALIEKANILIDQIKEKQRLLRKKRVKYSSIFGSITVALVIVIVLTIEIFIPLSKYNIAIHYINSKQYDEAIELLDDLEELYDTSNQLEAIKAYQCFENKNYETGIDKLYEIGGEVIVNFDANGGDAQITQKVIKKAKYINESATLFGYDFFGWELDDYIINNGKYKYSAIINLKAKYTPIEYTITYELNGGTLDNKLNFYTYNEKDVFIEAPTKTGYTFDGWSGTDIDGKINDLVIKKGTIGNKTYQANWKPNNYKIIFDVAGGDNLLFNHQIVEFNSQFDLPIPSRNAYEFDGWYYNDKLVESSFYIYSHDIELIAHWEPIEYRIRYYLDGGVFRYENPYVYTCESNNINIENPTKTGYTFDGWSGTDIDGKVKDLVINKGTSGNKTYQANWVANEYTITYDVNGGDELESTTQKVIFNQTFYLKASTKTGYIFIGWLYNGELFTDSSLWTLASNIELVASYSPRKDIKYSIRHYKENANDDNYVLYKTETLYGEADSNVIAYSESYFGFVPQNNKTIHINADGSAVLDFYYKREKNDITYYLNNGSYNCTISYKYEQTVSETASKDDLTFGGWYLDYNLEQKFNGIMPNEDINLYAYWEEETLTNLFDYSINKDSVSIDLYIGTNNNIRIPSYINDIPVKTIQTNSFINQSTLEQAFIPDSVTSIGKAAFYGCSSLTNITIPDSVTSIGQYAFSSCISLTSVTICNGVTSINKCAFRNCDSLTTLVIPDSVTNIGSEAFYGCSSLEHATIPAIAITDIPRHKLKSVIITSGDSIPDYAFKSYSSLENIVIPDSVTSIGIEAFASCSSLTNVVIPDSVTSIGRAAFYGCSSLINITIPDGVISIGDYAFSFCNSLTTLDIPDSVTSIGQYAFRGCSSLENITIPDSVISIGYCAFYECSSLEYAKIPARAITDIPIYKLKSVIITSGDSIPDYAFYGCSSLINITIPDSVTIIGSEAFEGCSYLQTVYYAGTEEQWNSISILGHSNTDLTNATIIYNYVEEEN